MKAYSSTVKNAGSSGRLYLLRGVYHFLFTVLALLGADGLGQIILADELNKVEQYCRANRDCEGDNKVSRSFLLFFDAQSKGWREQTREEARNSLAYMYSDKDFAEACVSIREGRTVYVLMQHSFDISSFGGSDVGPPLVMPTRSLSCEYYFYRNGQLAMLESIWLEMYGAGIVRRKKVFNDKGKLLLSTTEYTDTSADSYTDKPEEKMLPQIYRRVSELPFYHLLQKPRPKT